MNDQPNQPTAEYAKCRKCGSPDVQIPVWVELATGEQQEDYSDEETWCPQCEKNNLGIEYDHDAAPTGVLVDIAMAPAVLFDRTPLGENHLPLLAGKEDGFAHPLISDADAVWLRRVVEAARYVGYCEGNLEICDLHGEEWDVWTERRDAVGVRLYFLSGREIEPYDIDDAEVPTSARLKAYLAGPVTAEDLAKAFSGLSQVSSPAVWKNANAVLARFHEQQKEGKTA